VQQAAQGDARRDGQGARALLELTDAIKYSPGHLLARRGGRGGDAADDGDGDGDGNEGLALPFRPVATPFLDDAVRRVFRAHSSTVVAPGDGGTDGDHDGDDDDVPDASRTMDCDALSR